MTAPIFGNKPKKATMYLAKDADFIHDIEPETEAYPSGMEAWFVILDAAGSTLATWTGEVISNKASWNVQSDAVNGPNAIPGATKFRLFLRLDDDPTQEYLWYYGSIKWEQ